jgi:hypothetical protein
MRIISISGSDQWTAASDARWSGGLLLLSPYVSARDRVTAVYSVQLANALKH